MPTGGFRQHIRLEEVPDSCDGGDITAAHYAWKKNFYAVVVVLDIIGLFRDGEVVAGVKALVKASLYAGVGGKLVA